MMRSMVRLMIVWLWGTLSVAQAAVIVVDLNGSGGFTDIQSAVNAATSGDIIVVEPGIYYGDAQPWFLSGATATGGSGSAFVLTP